MNNSENIQLGLHCEHPGVWLFLLRTLAKGQPVSTTSVANALNMPLSDVEVALGTFADTVYDEKGDVVACGLSLIPTPHSFKVGGNELYTWCALDTLMYPVALGQVAQVESRCPVSGNPVQLTVTPTGVSHLSPAGVVLSLVAPVTQGGCCNVRNSFCNGVHFISSTEAAASWLFEHPNATIVSVTEAWQLGYAVIQRRLEGART